MADSDSQFPGFQVSVPKDEYVPRRILCSRLQRKAPRPLQIKQSVSFKSDVTPKAMAFLRDHLSSSSASVSPSLVNSLYQNKDPIPLLSPLASPSKFAESSAYTRNENSAKSH